MDFIGRLLPGYLAVTLFLTLFTPDLLFNPDRALSFDLFSAVVFVVAGPAVGLTLQQLHRHIYALMRISPRKEKKEQRKETCRQYAFVRLSCSAEEKLELDKTEADYDFTVSTGLVMTLLGTYYVVTKGLLEPLIPLGLFVLALIFFAGGYLERKESYSPTLIQLYRKYLKEGSGNAEPES